MGRVRLVDIVRGFVGDEGSLAPVVGSEGKSRLGDCAAASFA